MDGKANREGAIFSDPRGVAPNGVERGYAQRNVKLLIHPTGPQGNIKNMKIVEERAAWIHTHFVLDSFYVTEHEQRQISISVEPELMQLGIQYGLRYNIAPSKHRAIVVLECIPFDAVKEVIKQLINDVIKDFPVRLPEQRNVVTNITVAEPEIRQANISVQAPAQ